MLGIMRNNRGTRFSEECSMERSRLGCLEWDGERSGILHVVVLRRVAPSLSNRFCCSVSFHSLISVDSAGFKY